MPSSTFFTTAACTRNCSDRSAEKGPAMKLSDFLTSCARQETIQLTHFLITDDRRTICESCKPPYDMKSPRLFFSMTKSVASLAVGIAVQMGLFSLEDPVYLFFRDRLPERPHPHLFSIKVRHLLTMSTGIDRNTYPELVVRDDWVRAFLAQEFPEKPGTRYLYSTHASHMLSALITAASGQLLEDFLNENLFYPMGILDAQWERSPEGLTAGGMGLSLTPEAAAKLARLLLNWGNHEGKQLVPKEYLEEAASPQIHKQRGESPGFAGDQYGYQFHIASDGSCYLDGAFGQLILVYRPKGLAFIAFSQGSKTESLLAEIYRHFIFDDFQPERLPVPVLKQDFMPLAFPRGSFEVEANPLDISRIQFCENELRFTHKSGEERRIGFAGEGFFRGRARFIKDLQEHEQAYVSEVLRAAPDRLTLNIYWIETPYIVTCDFLFHGDGLVFKFDRNVSFTLRPFEVRGARLLPVES